MPGSEIVSYREQALTVAEELQKQPRFFLPREPVVNPHGVVGLLFADNRPHARWHSYTDSDWYGVERREEGDQYEEWFNDPVRRTHFIDTKKGFMLLRVFVLPQPIARLFRSDEFLGGPMVRKCASQNVFDKGVNLDEQDASIDYLSEAIPIIESVADAAWRHFGFTDYTEEFGQIWPRVSFHSWAYFNSAVTEAQKALEKGLGNFNQFLNQFAQQNPEKYQAPVRRNPTGAPQLPEGQLKLGS